MLDYVFNICQVSTFQKIILFLLDLLESIISIYVIKTESKRYLFPNIISFSFIKKGLLKFERKLSSIPSIFSIKYKTLSIAPKISSIKGKCINDIGSLCCQPCDEHFSSIWFTNSSLAISSERCIKLWINLIANLFSFRFISTS